MEIETAIVPDKFATGDYYCAIEDGALAKITANTENTITISPDEKFEKIPAVGSKIQIKVRLQRPYVDIEKCIGCGVCEHECPVSGKKAIRVSAEGETRSMDRKLLLKR
jgi:ferredoxin